MEDLKKMMPHHKAETKFEKNQDFKVLNEIAELASCIHLFTIQTHFQNYVIAQGTRINIIVVWKLKFSPNRKFETETPLIYQLQR